MKIVNLDYFISILYLQYPKCWQVECDKGPDSDKPNFAAFVKELKEAFIPHGLLLSAAVSPSKIVIDKGTEIS